MVEPLRDIGTKFNIGEKGIKTAYDFALKLKMDNSMLEAARRGQYDSDVKVGSIGSVIPLKEERDSTAFFKKQLAGIQNVTKGMLVTRNDDGSLEDTTNINRDLRTSLNQFVEQTAGAHIGSVISTDSEYSSAYKKFLALKHGNVADPELSSANKDLEIRKENLSLLYQKDLLKTLSDKNLNPDQMQEKLLKLSLFHHGKMEKMMELQTERLEGLLNGKKAVGSTPVTKAAVEKSVTFKPAAAIQGKVLIGVDTFVENVKTVSPVAPKERFIVKDYEGIAGIRALTIDRIEDLRPTDYIDEKLQKLLVQYTPENKHKNDNKPGKTPYLFDLLININYRLDELSGIVHQNYKSGNYLRARGAWVDKTPRIDPTRDAMKPKNVLSEPPSMSISESMGTPLTIEPEISARANLDPARLLKYGIDKKTSDSLTKYGINITESAAGVSLNFGPPTVYLGKPKSDFDMVDNTGVMTISLEGKTINSAKWNSDKQYLILEIKDTKSNAIEKYAFSTSSWGAELDSEYLIKKLKEGVTPLPASPEVVKKAAPSPSQLVDLNQIPAEVTTLASQLTIQKVQNGEIPISLPKGYYAKDADQNLETIYFSGRIDKNNLQTRLPAVSLNLDTNNIERIIENGIVKYSIKYRVLDSASEKTGVAATTGRFLISQNPENKNFELNELLIDEIENKKLLNLAGMVSPTSLHIIKGELPSKVEVAPNLNQETLNKYGLTTEIVDNLAKRNIFISTPSETTEGDLKIDTSKAFNAKLEKGKIVDNKLQSVDLKGKQIQNILFDDKDQFAVFKLIDEKGVIEKIVFATETWATANAADHEQFGTMLKENANLKTDSLPKPEAAVGLSLNLVKLQKILSNRSVANAADSVGLKELRELLSHPETNPKKIAALNLEAEKSDSSFSKSLSGLIGLNISNVMNLIKIPERINALKKSYAEIK